MNAGRMAMVAAAAVLAAGVAGFSIAADKSSAGKPAASTATGQASGAVRDVSVAEAQALMAASPGVIVLDVRTPAEFAEGHIEGAVNLDFRSPDFAQRLARLDRGARYLLHCKTGARSAGALAVMQQQGFGDIAHMHEGFDGWKASGRAVTR